LVGVVEKLGAEILLDLQVGDLTMVAAVEPTIRAKRGDKIRFALRPDRLHFFDAASEAAI
jgi:multiple sugar transport system ATP-binding protein